MKGDIAFVGFMLTAGEWQELDPQSRAQLIAVATRRADPVGNPPRRFPDGTGRHEIVESIDDELADLVELDADLLDADLLEPIDDGAKAALEAELARLDRAGDITLLADDAFTFDTTAEYDALEEWLALQPADEHTDGDEWVALPAAPAPERAAATAAAPCAAEQAYETFADWDF